ncbi:hypothetical protein OKA06_14800 [Novosphingobium sp. MW5]|nr:hypothetical protein [Novosphingobium sp. MW5]
MQDIKITRAMNVSLSEQQVRQLCQNNSLRISAIEQLVSGGTHVVLLTIQEADDARHLMRTAIITGKVKRSPFMHSRHR